MDSIVPVSALQPKMGRPAAYQPRASPQRHRLCDAGAAPRRRRSPCPAGAPRAVSAGPRKQAATLVTSHAQLAAHRGRHAQSRARPGHAHAGWLRAGRQQTASGCMNQATTTLTRAVAPRAAQAVLRAAVHRHRDGHVQGHRLAARPAGGAQPRRRLRVQQERGRADRYLSPRLAYRAQQPRFNFRLSAPLGQCDFHDRLEEQKAPSI